MQYFQLDENISRLHFDKPEWLWLIPVFVIVTYIIRRYLKAKNYPYESEHLILSSSDTNTYVLHPLIHLIKSAISSNKNKRSGQLIMSIALIVMIITMAEPVFLLDKIKEPPRKRDIVFLVDTSVSMILRDYVMEDQRVERMQVVKGLLNQFVAKLQGERMGIIVFADKAYTLVPLTYDQQLLRGMIQKIRTTIAGRYNAIGDAVAMAVKQAAEQPERHRILILMTAAGKPTGKIDPYIAAELAKDSGLPLYTIAVGATDYTAEEIRKSGLIYQPVNQFLLMSLAEITEAQHYLASDAKTLKNAIEKIKQRESNVIHEPIRYSRQPLYHWLLVVVITLILSIQVRNLISKR